ncbi:MAG: EamA family transporter RarD [Candidatus Synoicihabitans palmerolidicus]|nr:EamA family transporter RarD [Candidatus Synoicihabitans palmerolidicus]
MPSQQSIRSASAVRPEIDLNHNLPELQILTNRSPNPHSSSSAGAFAAFTSYLLWGVLPIYWKLLDGISVVELLAHRVIWTLVAVLLFQCLRHRWKDLRTTWSDRESVLAHLRPSAFLGANWGVYVWAVSNGRIIETSLGYFIVPWLNAACGRLIFAERLSRWQTIARMLAAAGVAVLIFRVGTIPWVALALAGTWAAYGLGRERSHASALETTFLLPIALGYLVWQAMQGSSTFGSASVQQTALMNWNGGDQHGAAHPVRLRCAP